MVDFSSIMYEYLFNGRHYIHTKYNKKGGQGIDILANLFQAKGRKGEGGKI